jgi:hypothetical protein
VKYENSANKKEEVSPVDEEIENDEKNLHMQIIRKFLQIDTERFLKSFGSLKNFK